MTDPSGEPQVPEDLAGIIRAAAGSMACYPGDLAAATRLGKARRRRYTASVAVGVAMLAAFAAGVPVLATTFRAQPQPGARSSASTTPSPLASQPGSPGPNSGPTGKPTVPGQLVLWPQRQLLAPVIGLEGYGVVPPDCGVGEVLPDGALGWLPSPPPLDQDPCERSVSGNTAKFGGNDPADVVPVPDGRLLWVLNADT